MKKPPIQRNVLLLAICQGLWMTGVTMVTTVSALASQYILGNDSFVTVPQALQIIAMMATTVPASALMKKLGRRNGLMCGAIAGSAGALVSLSGVMLGNFLVFCVGALLLGIYNGFA